MALGKGAVPELSWSFSGAVPELQWRGVTEPQQTAVSESRERSCSAGGADLYQNYRNRRTLAGVSGICNDPSPPKLLQGAGCHKPHKLPKLFLIGFRS